MLGRVEIGVVLRETGPETILPEDVNSLGRGMFDDALIAICILAP
jgi:hypothetical protein